MVLLVGLKQRPFARRHLTFSCDQPVLVGHAFTLDLHSDEETADLQLDFDTDRLQSGERRLPNTSQVPGLTYAKTLLDLQL